MLTGSLCTGYGGLDAAVREVLGGELAWVADIDEGACKILAERFPAQPNHGNITAADWGSIEPVDVFTAGFPCQPVSLAGKQLGEADERWIWPSVVRAVRDLRPALVFLENVSALVVRGLAGVAADLAQIGYLGSWCCLRASDIGACHRRERVFILAWPAADTGGKRRYGRPRLGGDGRPASVGQQAGRDGSDSRSSLAEDPDSTAGGERRLAAPGQAPSGWPRADTRRSGRASAVADAYGETGERFADASQRGKDGRAPADRDCPQAGECGTTADPASDGRDAWGPEPARLIRGLDAAIRGNALADPHGDGFPWSTQRHGEPERRQASHEQLDWGIYTLAIRRHERAFGRPAPRPTEPGRTGERLSPRFVEWMMGLPEGWVTDVPGLSRNAQLKALGNGVVPAQAAMALRMLLERADIPSLVAAEEVA